jgi:hypothetical protein
MNIVILSILLISLLNNVSSIGTSYGTSYGTSFRNNYLKLILLSDKRNIKIFKGIKNYYKICYEKSIASISQGICDYNSKLTEEEKTILETIISLYY